jgi:hypothetical protein
MSNEAMPGQVTVKVPPGTVGAAMAAGLPTSETAAAAVAAAHSMGSRRRLIDMVSPLGTVPASLCGRDSRTYDCSASVTRGQP